MKPVHQILFDFDYTIADSSSAVIACVNHALRQTGASDADAVEIRRMIGHSLEDVFGKLHSRPDAETVAACKKWFMQYADTGIMVAQTVLLDGVDTVLTALYEDFYTLGIVSTKRRVTIEETLTRLELDDLFDVIIGYEDVTRLKPDPEGLLKAIAAMEGAREDSLYVGDSLIDWHTARAAGVPFAAVCTGMTTRDDFLREGATVILNHLAELPGFLNRE